MSRSVNALKDPTCNPYCILRKITNYELRIISQHLVMMSGLILLLIATTACSGNTSTEPMPPEIHYGEDICEFCGMIVSEERFAAGYITENGQEYIFDDIGDMAQAQLQSQEEIIAIFVHDYENHTWILAENAHFVQSDDLATPMLSGLAAFSTVDQAQAFADGLEGQIFSYDELLTYYQENPEPALSNDN